MPSNEVVFGVDIGGSKISVGAARASGEVLDFFSTKISGRRAINVIISGIKQLSARNAIDLEDVAAIVLGVPGVVDANNARILSCPNLKEIEGTELVEEVFTLFPVDIYVENDVNLAALGEHRFGAGRGYRNLVAVYLGTGIGTGIIVEDRLLKGGHGWAGEMGHMLIAGDGPLCGCGNRGCFETFASGSAIARRAREKGLDPAELKELAESGDERALSVFNESWHYLAVGIANIVNIFDPEIILIGGGVAEIGGILFDGLIPKVRELLRPLYREALSITPVKLNYLAPILGSVALWMDAGNKPAKKGITHGHSDYGVGNVR